MNNESKKNIINTVFIITCLVLYFFFPFGGLKFENWLGMICVLFILPILYNKIILHKKSNIGFGELAMGKKELFFLITAIVLGGLLSFLIVGVGIGLNSYTETLSLTIVSHFGAFMFYELVFSALALFLFVFFSFGFVYSMKYTKQIYSKVFAAIVFIFFLIDFYSSLTMWIPLFIPILFFKQIKGNKHSIYIFAAVFVIALILDTLVIKSIS